MIVHSTGKRHFRRKVHT